jgi:hypothetical protein
LNSAHPSGPPNAQPQASQYRASARRHSVPQDLQTLAAVTSAPRRSRNNLTPQHKTHVRQAEGISTNRSTAPRGASKSTRQPSRGRQEVCPTPQASIHRQHMTCPRDAVVDADQGARSQEGVETSVFLEIPNPATPSPPRPYYVLRNVFQRHHIGSFLARI